MSSKHIKGIIVEIGGDTKKLSAAITDVDKTAKSIQSELRQVERLLKLDPKNTELLAQKQKLLGDAVKGAKDRLDALKKAQEGAEQAFREGKIGEEQYRAVKREVIAAESSLKRLTQQQDAANSKWKQAGDQISAFGNKAEALGKKLAPVSVAATAALTGIVALTTKSAAAADDLNTLAAQTGLTTEALQRFQYASDLIDVPLDTFTGSLSRLTRSMGSAQRGTKSTEDAFAKLGVRWKNNDGTLRDNEEVFYDIIDTLNQIDNATERDAIAMELFGRSAQDLNPLIKQGSEALKKYGDEAAAMGLILDQETLDSLNQFNDEMDKTKAQVQATGMVVGAEFGKVLLPIIQDLAKGIQQLAGWFRKLDPGVAKTILVVLGLLATLVPLILTFAKVAAGISTIMGLWTKLSAAAALAGTSVGAMILPFIGVVAAIGAVIAVGVALWKNWDKIKNFAANLWSSIVKTFNGIKDTIVGAFNALMDINLFEIGKNIIQGLINGVKSMIGNVGNTIKNVAKGAVNKLKDFLGIRSPSKVFEQLGAFTGEGFAKGIAGTSKMLGQATAGMGRSAMGGVARTLTEHTGVIRIEGVNDQGQLVAAQNWFMDELRKGVRRKR